MSQLEHHPDHLPCDRGDRGNRGERGGLVWRLCGMLLLRRGTLHPSWEDPLCLQGGLTPNDSFEPNFGRSIGNGTRVSTRKLWKSTTIQVASQ